MFGTNTHYIQCYILLQEYFKENALNLIAKSTFELHYTCTRLEYLLYQTLHVRVDSPFTCNWINGDERSNVYMCMLR